MRGVSRHVALLVLALGGAVVLAARLAAGVESGSEPAPDLSTPAKATTAFVAAMRAGDLQSIRATTIGGTDADAVMLRSWAAFIRSADRMRGAMEAKFGAGAGAAVMGGGLDGFGNETALNVQTDGDAATVSTPDGRQHVGLTRTGGKWRIDIAHLPNKDQLSSGAADMRAIAKITDRIAGEIAEGRYTSGDDAAMALGHAMEPVLEPERMAVALARQPFFTRPAVEFRPKSPVAGYDPTKVDAHRQLYNWSGIPMAVELVLKLAGREPDGYHALQDEWQDKRDGNFINFDGRSVGGLTFHHQFDGPRGNDFPIGALFKTINSELDHGRYVTIALYNGSGWGIFAIVGRTRSGDFHAVTKATDGRTFTVTNVKARVREMKGTDILTYTTDAPKDAGK
ncbi:MAG TPA: hypothetical protein VGI81_07670 [Tepidisphaeraceae bacterium]|jgi:hypothetical protein